LLPCFLPSFFSFIFPSVVHISALFPTSGQQHVLPPHYGSSHTSVVHISALFSTSG
jgi:hypothetical protein